MVKGRKKEKEKGDRNNRKGFQEAFYIFFTPI